jgi:hypothetical protein
MLPLGVAIMDTERILPPQLNGNSPGSQSVSHMNNSIYGVGSHHLYQNTSTGQIGHPHSAMNSMARKKKTDRIVPPVNNSSFLNQTNNIYSNHSNVITGSNGGITNHGYSRDARYFMLYKSVL